MRLWSLHRSFFEAFKGYRVLRAFFHFLKLYLYRSGIRKFFSEVDPERLQLWEETGCVDREFWLEAGKMKLIGRRIN
jgi:hypothetical protein